MNFKKFNQNVSTYPDVQPDKKCQIEPDNSHVSQYNSWTQFLLSTVSSLLSNQDQIDGLNKSK